MSSSLHHAQRGTVFVKVLYPYDIYVWTVSEILQTRMKFIWKYRMQNFYANS
jgi:hypothetical protein